MARDPANLLPPRLLVVDDERQVHASIRLRLGASYELEFAFGAREALEKIKTTRFDLCFADIHMPKMDGLAFIDAAQAVDPCLGFVILSAFDNHENLHRAIPLAVYEFLSKPLPERPGFEGRIPEWIAKTRQRRRDAELAQHTEAIAADRDAARLEREVELVASETARDALRQTAGFLTTIHAHLVSATGQLAARARHDSSLSHLHRGLEEALRITDATVTVAEGFFDSAYGSRDTSPALPNDGIGQAISIARRLSRAEETNKIVEFTRLPATLPIRNLSGVDFLLMMVPAVAAALACASASTTVGVRGEQISRLDAIARDPAYRGYCWTNRKHSPGSHPALVIHVTADGAPLSASGFESWLTGDYAPLTAVTPRRLAAGLEKCRGFIGAAVSPHASRFALVLVLPT